MSTATVSRVLNNNQNVSPETAKRVLAVIDKLGYQPNHLGRHLRKNETKTILVLVSTVANTLISKVISSIEITGMELGYTVLIGTTNDEKKRENAHIDLLRCKFIDGMIIINTLMNKQELACLNKRYNIVQCCESIPDTDVSSVSINNKEATYQAVKHLISLGRRKIAYIGVKNHLSSSEQRYLGYVGALTEFGIQIDKSIISDGNYGFRSAIEVMNKFLLKPDKPDAVFAISDRMAAGAVRAIKDNGRTIPDDIAVVGFDNTDISYISEPRLTTVSQSPAEMGKKAMQLLDKKLKGLNITSNVVIKHKLIYRESTMG
ncbi:MAG: LacI family transcriptional regulator [Clostridiaceae bacterium]|nr:LacI family transcriptional regulator [Clostridiaceae bacterium]